MKCLKCLKFLKVLGASLMHDFFWLDFSWRICSCIFVSPVSGIICHCTPCCPTGKCHLALKPCSCVSFGIFLDQGFAPTNQWSWDLTQRTLTTRTFQFGRISPDLCQSHGGTLYSRVDVPNFFEPTNSN